MICVIEVIEGPARGKRIWLKENQSFEVGRVSTADLSIPADAHLSRRHLLFEAIPDGFRIRDVGSANGTFVNNAKISIVELQTGDTIRAGMTVLSVSIRKSGENPHDRDGLSFAQSATMQSTNATVAQSEERSGTVRTVAGLQPFDMEQTVQIRVAENPKPEHETPAEKPRATALAPAPELSDSELGREIWWKSYFVPTAVSGVFEQTALFDGPEGNLAGLVLKFAKGMKLVSIINISQLKAEGVKFLQGLSEAGKVEVISRSLCFVKLNDHASLVQLVKNCEGQDALVVLGSQSRLGLAELKPHANSLSYPSMFSRHILDPDPSFRNALLKNDVFALFEPSAEWKVGLLIKD